MHKIYSFMLPIVSGMLLFLTTPAIGLEIFVWIALVPMFIFLAQEKTTSRKALFGGTIAGFIYIIGVLYPLSSLNAWWWISSGNIVSEYRSVFLLLFLIFVALYTSILVFGVFGIVFNTLFKKIFNSIKNPWIIPLSVSLILLPLLWSVLEWIREFAVLSFTWGHLGYSLHNSTYLLPLASIAGVYGLSFLIVSVNILLTLAITNHKRRYPKFAPLLIAGVLLLSAHAYGYIAITSADKSLMTVKVAVVHTGLTTIESIGVAGYNKHMELILEALSHKPDIVVLPENSFPFFIIEHDTMLPLQYGNENLQIKTLFDRLLDVSSSHSAVSFAIGFHTEDSGKRFNSLVVLENGAITGIYNKRTLMPLAESSPRALRKTHVEPIDKGGRDQNITIAGKEITPLICSEIIFPKLSKNKESSLIINISNDSVFNSQIVSGQNHIMAKIRAAENRVFVIRTVKGGVSSIIDPYGRVIVQSEAPYNKEILIGYISY